MDYTVRGILEARILEWVAFTFSRGFSQPRDQNQVSHIADRLSTSWATREAHNKLVNITKKTQAHRYREQTSGYQWSGGAVYG